MSKNKGISGVGDGRFDPNGLVARAQFARFTAQAFDIAAGTKTLAFMMCRRAPGIMKMS